MGAPPESELEIFSYEDFGVGIRWLAEQLVARDWIPDVILGVVRGGLFVSTALAYALDIKDVRHVNVEFYTDAGETLPEPAEAVRLDGAEGVPATRAVAVTLFDGTLAPAELFAVTWNR